MGWFHSSTTWNLQPSICVWYCLLSIVGLRADTVFSLNEDGTTPAPFIRKIIYEEGRWGVSHIRDPLSCDPTTLLSLLVCLDERLAGKSSGVWVKFFFLPPFKLLQRKQGAWEREYRWDDLYPIVLNSGSHVQCIVTVITCVTVLAVAVGRFHMIIITWAAFSTHTPRPSSAELRKLQQLKDEQGEPSAFDEKRCPTLKRQCEKELLLVSDMWAVLVRRA